MQWQKFGILISLFLLITACNQGNQSSTDIESKIKSGKKLASRGEIEVYEGYLELLQGINPNIKNQLKTPMGKKRLVDNLLDQETLYQESIKKGVDKLPKYREKAALYKRVIISQGLLEEATTKKAKAYYDKNKEKEFSQVKVSHILIRPQQKDKAAGDTDALAKAKEAKKKLDGGVAWEEVVVEYTDDRLTKTRGGELGSISRQDRRATRLGWKDLIDQAFQMKTGEISEPIKAKDGYHIIKVIESAQVAPFEEVKPRIEFKLREPTKKEVLSGLGSQTKVEYYDEALKGAGPGALSSPPKLPTPTKKPEEKTKEAKQPAEAPKPEEKTTEKK